MSTPLKAEEILDREYLDTRAKILEVAAALDRLDRAEGDLTGDSRLDRLQQSLKVLSSRGPGRAERIQMTFSLPYDEDWRRILK